MTDAHLMPSFCISEPRFHSAGRSFYHRAQENPDAIALVQGNFTWRYGELFDACADIEKLLREAGFQAGDVVAVTGPRSFQLIAGIVAVFLIRGILLTIDPKLPFQRRKIMVEESRTRYILSAEPEFGDAAELAEDSGAYIILISRISPGNSRLELRFKEPKPEDPAYIFFTSGTTARQKGVLGQHKGVSQFLHWQRTTFNVEPSDRCSQIINLSFDVILRDIFLPLSSGAALCLPPAEESGVDSTLEWIIKTRITLIHTVPTLMRAWISLSKCDRQGADLRLAFFSGEFLSSNLAQDFRSVFPFAKIVNLYGPTETTMAKTYYVVPEIPEPGMQPVGTPLPQTEILLFKTLDASANLESIDPDRLCGRGETGEIAIRTPFGTLGYLNASQEDLRRFQPNPFGNDPSDKIYFTGDLGRIRQDGMLELLGRTDDQVKIQGVRVDPREIKSSIESVLAVRQCEVLAMETGDGKTRLVAYVTPDPSAALTERALRKYLMTNLPPAYIPSRFLFLSSLPIGANGKVDRNLLYEMGKEMEMDLTLAYKDAPRTPFEVQLADLWKEVLGGKEMLGIQKIARTDNFFELGGDSLSAVEFLAAANAQGLNLTSDELARNPTLDKLAMAIRGRNEQVGVTPVIGERDVVQFALLPSQCDILELPKPETFTLQPRFFEATNSLEPEEIQRTLIALIQHHHSLCMRFVRTEAGWKQILEQARDLELPQVPVLNSFNEIQSLLRFDLSKPPLIRAAILKRNAYPDMLVLIIHHLVCDGYSERILLNDFLAIFNHGIVPIPPADNGAMVWAQQLASMSKEERYLTECQYWCRDHPKSSIMPGSVKVKRFESEIKLRRRFPANHLRDACLAASLRAIAVWSGVNQFWMDIVHHGRTESGSGVNLARTVGCLYWLYPVWFHVDLRLRKTESVEEAARQLAAAPRNGLSYNIFRWIDTETGMPERLKGIAPQFCFNYLGDVKNVSDKAAGLLAAVTPQAQLWKPSIDDLEINLPARLRLFFARTDDGLLQYGYIRASDSALQHFQCLLEGELRGLLKV